MHGITAIMIAAVLFLPLGAQPVPGRMSFGTRSIDLGTVSEDSAMVTASVEWKNTGDSPVAVLMAKTTCNCLAVEYDRTPVPPGGTGRMVLTYYPKGHPGKIDRKVFVYAGLEASGPDAVLYVTGEVEPSSMPVWQYPHRMGALLLKQTEVNIAGNAPQVERVACMNAGDSPLEITAMEGLLPEGLTFRCEPQVLQPGETGDLVIGFDPARLKTALPDTLPVILEGLALPPSRRTLTVRTGAAATEGTFAYPGRNEERVP